MKVPPFQDDQRRGIFAARHPLSLSVVQMRGRLEKLLYFTGADMLDETPLFDIKPYIPDFDIFPVEIIGWYQRRKYS